MDTDIEGRDNVLPFPAAPEGIEFRHLRAFVAVAEELNFSRAAERLYITQPALSRQIRVLERLVGCDLLRRTTHRVETTLAGDALLERARATMSELDAAISVARSVGGGDAQRLARLWGGMVDATATGGEVAAIRSATEELHARFAPPPDVDLRAHNAGGVPALLSVPPGGSGPPLLFLHGGGHVGGSAFGYRHLSGAMALVCGRPVLVPEFRLAPEHPYPADLEDALRAYLSVLDDGADPADVAVAGDSSGGLLTMTLLLALRDRELPMPGRAVLMCPWVDLSGTLQRAAPPDASGSGYFLTGADARRFGAIYLAGHPLDDPTVDLFRADLSGLPPLLVQAGTGDTVLPEAQMLVDRATSHGVDARLQLFPVPTHDFHIFWTFLPEAGDALDQVGRFVAGSSGAAGAAGV